MDYHYGFEINFRSVIFLRFADPHQEVSAPAAPEGQTPPVRPGGAREFKRPLKCALKKLAQPVHTEETQ